MAQRVGAIIATRRLKWLDRRGSVLISIGIPRRRRTGEWACPYQLTGLNGDPIRRALGMDSVQALHLALEAVRLDLEPYEQQLTMSGEPGDLFLPQYVPYYYGTEFAKHLGGLIEAELHREGRRIRERVRRRDHKRRRGRHRRSAAA